jgi:3-oxoacyl-[acyl-carrier-protein] synthase II
MKQRVVVTGVGMVTPVAIGVEQTWQALLNSKSGIGRIKYFDCESFQTKIAGEINNFDFQSLYPQASDFKHLGKHSQFAIVASKMALENAGLLNTDVFDRKRAGIYLGSGEGEFDFDGFVKLIMASWGEDEIDADKFFNEGMKILNPMRELEHDSNRPAAHLASIFGFFGSNSNCLTACAASSQAIGEAYSIIRRGDADIMLSGGSHSMIHPLGVMGFNLLTALSTQNDEPQKASKPFDRDRDGFVLGEGSAILILEELNHAKARGANILGEIIGYGTSADAYRITDTHPEGRGAICAISRAMHQAGIEPQEIDYISAHGTSTSVNDSVETLAIKDIFAEYAKNIPVSSIKSMLGHLIAAAGAVEAIICLLAIRDGIIPPTINYNNVDPQCDLDYVPNKSRKHKVNTALSNSFGFGGQNVALIIRRYPF